MTGIYKIVKNTFELDTPAAVKEKLRSVAPAGASIVQYKDIPEFLKDYPHSTNLNWIENAIQALAENGAH